MKRTLITTSLLAFVSILSASAAPEAKTEVNKTSPAKAEPSAPATPATAELRLAYGRAASYDDLLTAGVLAHQLIQAEPSAAGLWKEELAKIYFSTQRQGSCLKVCDDLIKNHGGNSKTTLLEMRALCLESLQRKEEAISAWQAVWEKSQNATAAVRLAGLYFEAGKYDEADKVIAAGLAAKDGEKAIISLPRSRDEMQQIPATAALHNLKALILMKKDSKNTDAPKAELEAALKIAPDFELAKRNLKGLTSKPEEASK
jgi:tetratricopeptide (TPR) repeat protein